MSTPRVLAAPAGVLLSRLGRAYRAWPEPREWRRSLLLFGAYGAAALPLASASGLVQGPEAWLGNEAWWLLPGALVWPSLIEETFFRVLLCPHSAERVSRRRRLAWNASSLTLYVALHPVNALLFRPDARGVFDMPGFLVLATLLGVLNLGLYQRTGSVWPPVLAHWLTVALWLFFGGKALLRA